jgi:DNA-binding HxlR family transcriptional regulator
MIINGKEMEIKLHGQTYHCALDVTMGFIGGKWKSVVLWYLIENHKRFGELKKEMPGITEKMLSLQLKQLEKDGIISRKVFAEVPPRVEYCLTEHGKTLIPLLKEMALWGRTKATTEGIIVEVEKMKKKKKTKKKK